MPDEKQRPVIPPLKQEEALVEGLDYYILENGYWVFTEHYHRKRGYCCNSGCRHCPYGYHERKRWL